MGNEFQSFYTDSQPILSYMVDLLDPQPGKRVLEPSAGSGLFIDQLLERQPEVEIDAYELNPAAAQSLMERYSNRQNVHVTHADTLLDVNLQFRLNMGGYYDYVIANPPYGAWQEYAKRKLLKKLYPGLYVKETYALFLYQALRLLNPGGRLVFIVSDTFLNLHMHKSLRTHLLTEGCIEEISLFPSSFFPGVNFGYSNLCIIAIRRIVHGENVEENEFSVKWDFSDATALSDPHAKVSCKRIRQRSLLNAIDHALFLTGEAQYESMISCAVTRIADVASCVTGFYSGNDKEFLRVLSHGVRNGRKYRTVDQSMIHEGPPPTLEGIHGSRHFVPIVKGGGVRFYKPDLWFMDWSAEAVRHYKTDRKARFQNSDFYFRQGIALPMVSSNSVTASLITDRLFDQSIVGIFPHEPSFLYYLLGFFNTDLCTTLLRTINPSANNSANYVKKLPFVMPRNEELDEINALVQTLILEVRERGSFAENRLSELNRRFIEIYSDTDRLENNRMQRTRTSRAADA